MAPPPHEAFLRRPPSKELGIGEEFVKIDLRAGIGWVGTCWRRTPDRLNSQTGRFAPDYSISLLDWGLSPDELLDKWREINETTESILEMCREVPEGAILAGQLLEAQKAFPEFVKALACAKEAQAMDCLQEYAYALQAATTTAVSGLAKWHQEATQQSHLAGAMTDIVEGDDVHGLYEFVALSLAEAIVNGVHAVLSMRNYESELDTLIEEVGSNYDVWQMYTDAQQHPDDLREDLLWISGSETAFTRRAQRLLLTPDAPSMSALILEARTRLQAISDKLVRLKGDFDTARIMVEELLSQQLELEKWVRAYTNSRKIIEQFGGSRGRDVFAVMNEKLTRADYEQWGEIVVSEEWRSPHAAQARMGEKSAALQAMLSCPPVLPPASQSIIDAAEEYVIRLERKLRDTKSSPSENDEVDDEEEILLLETAPSRTMTEEERVEEIYEMMIAVGAIKYCNKSNFTGGTPKAIFDILVRLGKISSGEIQTKGQLLERKMNDDGFLTPTTSKRASVWESTAPGKGRWMRFVETRGAKKIPMTLHRLLRRHESEGKRFALKHGIEAEKVVEAYEARRTEYQARRTEYAETKKNGSGHNDSK